MRRSLTFSGILMLIFGVFTTHAQYDFVKRINCGGTVSANYDGKTFEPESSASGVTYNGEFTSTTLNYAGLSEPMKSIRYTKNPSMYYEFAVANGNYRVLLHFAEVYHGVAPGTNPDTRKFNVDVENGQFSVTDLNVFSAAGGNAGDIYTIDTTVNVTDGSLTITFSKGSGNDPIINAIEVLGDTSPPSQPTASIVSNTDTSIELNWSSTDNIGIAFYKLFVGGNEIPGIGQNTNHTISGLLPETSYVIKIEAHDEAGNMSDVVFSAQTNTASGGDWVRLGSSIYYNDGNVGIGTNIPDAPLAVNGRIHAREVKVDVIGWPDYVFSEVYPLPELEELENYIAENGHLINVPSASEVEENGLLVGEMNKLLLEKIEELTLYIIEQNGKQKQLEARITALENKE